MDNVAANLSVDPVLGNLSRDDVTAKQSRWVDWNKVYRLVVWHRVSGPVGCVVTPDMYRLGVTGSMDRLAMIKSLVGVVANQDTLSSIVIGNLSRDPVTASLSGNPVIANIFIT